MRVKTLEEQYIQLIKEHPGRNIYRFGIVAEGKLYITKTAAAIDLKISAHKLISLLKTNPNYMHWHEYKKSRNK